MALKVIFVGGIYPVEFSLYKESIGNPDLDVLFVAGCGEAMPGAIEIVKPTMISSAKLLDNIKADFKPDITLFRSWCPEAKWRSINPENILWAQEIYPTRIDETKSTAGSTGVNECNIAYQNKLYATNNQYWLPYCVSKYWEKPDTKNIRDIPVMLATSLPSDSSAIQNKRRSLDILAKPIAENLQESLYVYNGYYGRLESMPYLVPCIKPSFPCPDMTSFISRAKIYLSPTSIWYDTGSISHKTVQAMACGCLVFTNKYPGIEEIVGKDKEHLIYCNTAEETLDMVKYYLTHDKERLEIAQRGMEFIHTKYNWVTNLRRLSLEITHV